jgi:hypothetical protein
MRQNDLRAPSDDEQRAPCRERNSAFDHRPLAVERMFQHTTEAAWRGMLGASSSAKQSRSREYREKGGHERGDSLDLEARAPQLSEEVGASVASHVMSLLVEGTPEPRVLRNENDDSAARSERLGDLLENPLVLVDVLENVESPNHVERRVEGKVTSVDPHELDLAETFPCHRKTLVVKIAADDVHARKRVMDTSEDVSGSRAQLQEVTGAREVTSDHGDNQAIPGAKPEALLFEPPKLVERLDGEALLGAHRAAL